ncbi:tryptophan-rich sensory protein [Jannaschia sp. S6380]|uniref:tryptophan-rich sensory protein TspO n=1 Tax=Jannaschia sp. S6380 TaxID=2926408 RepID=UPI001FF15233|nr:TspO/MBR family protein [Jannaschia sp. S6380]MCK0167685.1 tryptophan-rich sensory protein [Jannaschia sp. S6380]
MDLLFFLLFLAACGATAATGALFPPGAWYDRLAKPSWVPPDWLFPVAWTTIHLLISAAGAYVAQMNGSGLALAFWALQSAASALWTPVFFGLRRMKSALLVVGVLWLAVLGATIAHWQLSLWAGLAFLPYLAWVTVATALNAAMIRLNPDVRPLRPDQA